jgi:hypothetical protein
MNDLLKAAQKTTKAMFEEVPSNVQITATVKFHESKKTKNFIGVESVELLDRFYTETVGVEQSLLGWKQKDTTTCESSSKQYQVALLLQCSLSSRDVGVDCIIKRLTSSGSTEYLSQIKSLHITIPADKIGSSLRREDVALTDDPENPRLEITIKSK